MPVYYAETDRGCGLIEARDKRQAWADLRCDEGASHAKGVRMATDDDITWIKAMGGYVPPAAR